MRAALCLVLASAAVAQHQANGVKIGEVAQHTAVVWTRATRVADLDLDAPVDGVLHAVPGAPAEVRLVYGPQRGGAPPRTTPWTAVDAARDFTHQFQLEGLAAGTPYFLRSEARAPGVEVAASTVGAAFHTAPAVDQAAEVVFTVITGQEFHRRDDPRGGHGIYPRMAALEPHFLVHTGDVVYYDKAGPLAKTEALARLKWQRMYALPLQRDFHRRAACYFLPDDHDTLKNDCWPGQTYGELTWERGLALFDEQTPAPTRPYRRVRWGRDLEVWLLEGREFRSPNNMPDGPDKTILGAEQRHWLEETLRASDASFRVVISATPIVGPDRTNKNDNHANVGFQTEGDWLRALLAGRGALSICGDRHWQYLSEDPATGLVEFSCGPTSDQHAGGFGNEPRDMHRYLRVKGGFLSVTVARQGDAPLATFRHHDVEGVVRNEVELRAADRR